MSLWSYEYFLGFSMSVAVLSAPVWIFCGATRVILLQTDAWLFSGINIEAILHRIVSSVQEDSRTLKNAQNAIVVLSIIEIKICAYNVRYLEYKTHYDLSSNTVTRRKYCSQYTCKCMLSVLWGLALACFSSTRLPIIIALTVLRGCLQKWTIWL